MKFEIFLNFHAMLIILFLRCVTFIMFLILFHSDTRLVVVGVVGVVGVGVVAMLASSARRDELIDHRAACSLLALLALLVALVAARACARARSMSTQLGWLRHHFLEQLATRALFDIFDVAARRFALAARHHRRRRRRRSRSRSRSRSRRSCGSLIVGRRASMSTTTQRRAGRRQFSLRLS